MNTVLYSEESIALMQRAEWERKVPLPKKSRRSEFYSKGRKKRSKQDNQDELDDHNRGKIEKHSDPDEEVPVKNTTEAEVRLKEEEFLKRENKINDVNKIFSLCRWGYQESPQRRMQSPWRLN